MIRKISLNQLKEWKAQGPLTAFVGAYAELHARVHAGIIRKIAARKPELKDWQSIIMDLDMIELVEAIQVLYMKRASIVLTPPFNGMVMKSMMATGDKDWGESSMADEITRRVGAINMALWRPEGYKGISTDGGAFAAALFDAHKVKLKGKKVIVLGSGALSRAIGVEALQEGCDSLCFGIHNLDAASGMLLQIDPQETQRNKIYFFNITKLSTRLPPKSIIVNTNPIGENIDVGVIPQTSVYFDTTLIPTPAIIAAEKAGIPASMGRGMLACQLCRHLELLSGEHIRKEDVEVRVNMAAAACMP